MYLKLCLKKVFYILVLLLDVYWINNNGNWVEFSVGWMNNYWNERKKKRERKYS